REEQGVAVARRFRRRFGGDVARRTAAVLDDDRLLPVRAQTIGHHAPDDVGRASRSVADQQAYGADGILLGVRCERSRKRAEGSDTTAKHHVISPKNSLSDKPALTGSRLRALR